MNDKITLGNNATVGAVGHKAIGSVKVKKFYQEPTWWWGLFWGFLLGIPSSYLASWLWALFPLK
jgi:hypothetical protein